MDVINNALEQPSRRQRELLRLLAQRQCWTISEFARACQTSNAAATKNVSRLERRGFVKRTPNIIDKREVHVSLTPAGVAALSTSSGYSAARAVAL